MPIDHNVPNSLDDIYGYGAESADAPGCPNCGYEDFCVCLCPICGEDNIENEDGFAEPRCEHGVMELRRYISEHSQVYLEIKAQRLEAENARLSKNLDDATNVNIELERQIESGL